MIFFDTIDFESAPQRDRFLIGVCKRLSNVDRAALEATLLKLPDTLPPEVHASQPASEPATTPVKVVIAYIPNANGKKGTATAELDGNAVYIDSSLDPLNPKHRARLIKALTQVLPTLDKSDTDAQLLAIAQQEVKRIAEQEARRTWKRSQLPLPKPCRAKICLRPCPRKSARRPKRC
jgi:hypothetical protein